MKSLFDRYDTFENYLIARFKLHPFFQHIKRLDDEAFIEYLLQLGHLSLNFIKWEDFAKLPLSESAREVVRAIIRDEVPLNDPTHQDNRYSDLCRIGVQPAQVLNTPPTAATHKTIQKFYSLVQFPQDELDLRVLVTLRVLGEITVAETYRVVVEELERRFNFKAEDQRFYAPHRDHDEKHGSEDPGDAGHTENFDAAIEKLIDSEGALAVAQATAISAVNVRYSFHNQFLPDAIMWRKMFRTLGAAATITILVITGWGISFLPATIKRAHLQTERERYENFVRTTSPVLRDMCFEADFRIMERARRTGSLVDLKKIGTFATLQEWWNGP